MPYTYIYIYIVHCKARKCNVVYIWTWKPSLSICCTMFQHWINAKGYPVTRLCVNTLPATKPNPETWKLYENKENWQLQSKLFPIQLSNVTILLFLSHVLHHVTYRNLNAMTFFLFRKINETFGSIWRDRWGTLLVAQLVEKLRYKPEGRGFDSRWCYWNFSLTWFFRSHYGPGVDSVINRNQYQEYFLQEIL
jgi:hypothetical protein